MLPHFVLTRFVTALLVAGLSLVALSILAAVASGQEPVRIEIDQIVVEEGEGGSSLTVVISVSDQGRRPIPGLTSFETQIDGLPVMPTSVASAVDDDAGVAVLLLIDASGSMSGDPIAQARNAASIFVQELRGNDSAAVVPFGTQAPAELEFLSDAPALQNAVAALAVEERNQGTALYDSIAGVLNATWETSLQRQALILLTDGRESGRSSVADRDGVLAAAAAAGLPVFAIGLGPAADLELLRELASAGGGSFYFAPGPDDIPTIFEAIGSILRSQYVLSLPIPESSRDERSVVVQLELSDAVLTAEAVFSMPASAQPSTGGGVADWYAPAGIAALLLSAIVFLWLRRHGQQKGTYVEGGAGVLGVPLRGGDRPLDADAVAGSLTVLDGPNSGARIAIGRAAVEIGTAAECGLRLDGTDGKVAPTHVRVWLKGDRLMLHHVARKRETFVGERAVEWATLEPRETLRIGPHVIGFAILPVS